MVHLRFPSHSNETTTSGRTKPVTTDTKASRANQCTTKCGQAKEAAYHRWQEAKNIANTSFEELYDRLGTSGGEKVMYLLAKFLKQWSNDSDK